MDSISSCDLHIHSHYSDGVLSPVAIVRAAADAGLSAISITDHDNAAAQDEALREGETLGVEVLTGIEFSVKEEGLDIHILGYCFDPSDERLTGVLADLERSRLERAEMISGKLRALGLPVTMEEISGEAGGGTVGRPHFARVMMRKGLVSGFQEAFDRYIGYGAPCYVPKKVLSLDEVVALIGGAGGVAVWAHPGANIGRRRLGDMIFGAGVVGVEAWHPNHTDRITGLVIAEARKRGLILTGGSDYHFDEAQKASIGEIRVPYESVLALRRLARGVSS